MGWWKLLVQPNYGDSIFKERGWTQEVQQPWAKVAVSHPSTDQGQPYLVCTPWWVSATTEHLKFSTPHSEQFPPPKKKQFTIMYIFLFPSTLSSLFIAAFPPNKEGYFVCCCEEQIAFQASESHHLLRATPSVWPRSKPKIATERVTWLATFMKLW